MEAAANPYQTPEGNLQQAADDAAAEVRIFSPSGRIGRLRYLAYGAAMALLSWVIMAIPLALSAGSGAPTESMLFGVVNFAVAIGGLVLGVIWIIKRVHDMDKSGWLALLMFIPLVNLIFMLFLIFAPGTQGGNRFGPPPVQNTTGIKILAFFFPAVMILGIAAAIIIPMAAQ